MMFSDLKSIPRLRCNDYFASFFTKFLLPGLPCIIDKCLTENWAAVREWVKSDGSIDFQFLVDHFGSSVVPIMVTDEHASYVNAAECLSKQLTEFLEWMQMQDPSGMAGHRRYLKDWHFCKACPGYQAYDIPSYFQSDWLNEYWDMKDDSVEQDYRFVYIGQAGTCCSLGHLSTLTCFVRTVGQQIFVVGSKNEGEFLNDIRPFLTEETAHAVTEVVQEAGETIFVPSGWFHQVHNLVDTISINHNWINSSNIADMRRYIDSCAYAVEKEIYHLKDDVDWPEQCRRILKADIGIDREEFTTMLQRLLEMRRLRCSQMNLSDFAREFDVLDLDKTFLTNCKCPSAYEMCSSCSRLLLCHEVFVLTNELKNRTSTS